MEEKKINDNVLPTFCPGCYYTEISDFILDKITESPSPQVAYILTDMLCQLAKELFIPKH